MSLRADLATARISNQAKFRHISQGETGTLILLQHDNNESGGTMIEFDPALRFSAGTYAKARIEPGVVINDGRGQKIFDEELQLPSDALTRAQGNLVLLAVIDFDCWFAAVSDYPAGLQQYWSFVLRRAEPQEAYDARYVLDGETYLLDGSHYVVDG